MVNELIVAIAVGAASLGAIASTLQGYWATAEGVKYSFKKLFGALIGSVFVSFGVVNLIQIPEQFAAVGYFGLFIAHLILGYGIDKAVTASKKD